MNESESRRRFRELLPWHVNGTLDEPERDWIEDYLREHPDARAELRWQERLQAQIRQAIPPPTHDVGLERFMARIHAEAGMRAAPAPAPATPEPARAVPRPGLGERIRAYLATWQLTPAMAVAATVVVAQAGIIGALLVAQQGGEDAEFATVRSVDPGQVVSGPVLQVSFRPETSEADLRALLVGIGGTLVGGPGQLGNYLVIVPPGRVEQASRQLAANRLVEDVSVLQQIPARE
jgi:hypothetical protein